jgi:peroxiredoxin
MAGVTIAAQVDEMKRSGPEEPDPRMAAFAREQAGLAHTSAPDRVADVGTSLPDAELLDPDGSRRSLAEAAGDGLTVLVLYRGAWCPFCNIALRTYQGELLPGLRERGVDLIAISPQKPDGSLTMKEKHDLEFAVLSDPGLGVARAIGVLTAPTAESLAAQLELGLDLGEVNADGTAALPMPTVAIIDGDLRLRWVDVHPDYTTRTEPEQILAALDDLEGRP